MSGTAGAEREIQQPALQTRWIDRGTLIPNLQNPRSYPRRQKITIVVIVAIASFSAPFASNIIMPSFPFIGPALKLNSTGVSLTSEFQMPPAAGDVGLEADCRLRPQPPCS